MAGLIGTMLLVLLAPYIVKVALEIGAADYFAIMLLAFIAVTAVLGRRGSAASPRWPSASPSA